MDYSDRICVLPEAESTNDTLMQLAKEQKDLPQLYTIVAINQTAGRGQRGNSWSVTSGKNLTYSTLVKHDDLSPSEQYMVSELIALSTLSALRKVLPEQAAQDLSIKWPNDIYYQDKKLGGILIEHSITGTHIDFSVAGIGLNINEEHFPSHLPNPISLYQITGKTYDLESLHIQLIQSLADALEGFLNKDFTTLHTAYMNALYRREGLHRYQDGAGSFLATIHSVLPSGQIVLARENGSLHTYSFKEIIFDAD